MKYEPRQGMILDAGIAGMDLLYRIQLHWLAIAPSAAQIHNRKHTQATPSCPSLSCPINIKAPRALSNQIPILPRLKVSQSYDFPCLASPFPPVFTFAFPRIRILASPSLFPSRVVKIMQAQRSRKRIERRQGKGEKGGECDM